MRTDELDYRLPPELIADAPPKRREDARLLVVRRDDPAAIEHARVRDLPRYIHPQDAVVLNDTRVLRARLLARRADTAGRVEGLFLSAPAPDRWRVMLKASNRLRPGLILTLPDERSTLELLEKDADGVWTVRADTPHPSPPEALEALGAVPLPPYIRQARKQRGRAIDDPQDADRYQTTYASGEAASVAAPTAGLHLTPQSLDAIQRRGAAVERVTLHVGAGTFKPVETETLEEHDMHAEWIRVPAETLAAVDAAKRTLAVGTTSARALESVPETCVADWSGDTDLLIAPGYRWKRVDALLTNFHLPRSTLLAIVGALFPDGVPDLLQIYHAAIAERYRFYSYGDAMLILP